jgi:hypothetical protein
MFDRLRARFLPCPHPPRCREDILSGIARTTQCGLCGQVFDVVPEENPTKGTIMALDVASIESEVKSAVSEATSVADLADKYADILVKYTGFIPGAGPEVATYIGWLDTATKALNELNAAAQGL